MGTKIFYFSATGNSLEIARNISQELKKELKSVDIVSMVGEKIKKLLVELRNLLDLYFLYISMACPD